jgi:hypothetical protein
MKHHGTRNESPRAFAAEPEPAAPRPPRSPDSRVFRLLLNGGDPYLRRVAELVRRLWMKQRPREDAEAILAQVLEDLAAERYALGRLAGYIEAVPLVASPCRSLARMIVAYDAWIPGPEPHRHPSSRVRQNPSALSQLNLWVPRLRSLQPCVPADDHGCTRRSRGTHIIKVEGPPGPLDEW